MKKALSFMLVIVTLASLGCTPDAEISPYDTTVPSDTTISPDTKTPIDTTAPIDTTVPIDTTASVETVVPVTPTVPIPIEARGWYATYNKDNDACFLYFDLSDTDKKISVIDCDIVTKQYNEYTGIYEELSSGEISASFGGKKISFAIKDLGREEKINVTLTACDIEEYKHLLGKELTFGAGATIPDTVPSDNTKTHTFELYEVINGINSETDERTKLTAPVSLSIALPDTWEYSNNIIFDDSVRKAAGFYIVKRAEVSPLLYKLPDDMKWDENTFERMSSFFTGYKATPFTTASGYNAVEYSEDHFQTMPDSQYVYYRYLIQVSDEYAVSLTLIVFELTDKGTVDARDIANSVKTVK